MDIKKSVKISKENWNLKEDKPEIKQIFGHHLAPGKRDGLVAIDFNFPAE